MKKLLATLAVASMLAACGHSDPAPPSTEPTGIRLSVGQDNPKTPGFAIEVVDCLGAAWKVDRGQSVTVAPDMDHDCVRVIGRVQEVTP